ncbi:biotin/lipoyl-binding protein [Shimazuella sp. AN120528]|uniref:biotin/lipoyl-containing protein n=1 Tax=Shimazuella soli TaxID=1892854 RepID=UPI001F0D5F2F|nr:biotin/lipoyl-containing protein [Shimazuella soli]MCH5584026.1 biotin/lipoyl-binding protein [Shimazuella soli]
MAKVEATIVGIVSKILVSIGEEIQKGQEVIVLESMKMLIPVESAIAGKVTAVHVKESDFVNEGEVLIELEELV